MSPGLMSAMRLVPGANTPLKPSPKNLINGVSTRQLSTPPAIMMEPIRGPMI